MGNISKRAQDNLWGLYEKYFWEPNLGNMWEVCRKYLCGPKIVYGIVWVF